MSAFRIARRLLAAYLLGALLCASTTAHADDDATATAAARERFKEGVAYFDQKQYEKARAAFLQAYALKKHPAVLLNLAQSELRSGHEPAAAKHFAQYLREATDASPGEREAAQAGLTSARQAVVEISVTTDAGAEVLVDGESQGTAPLTGSLYATPGTHTLEARLGERTAKQTITAKAGESKEARLVLTAQNAAAPVTAPTSKTPATSEPAGDGPVPEDDSDDAGGGRREPFMQWLLTRPTGVISGGATVLLGLGAGGFAIAATVSYADADDTAQQIQDAAAQNMIPTRGVCTDPRAKLIAGGYPASDLEAQTRRYQDACAQHRDSVDQGDTFKTVALVAGIGAGAMAVTTAVLYFTTAPVEGSTGSRSDASPQVAIVPWGSPGSAGVNVLGRF